MNTTEKKQQSSAASQPTWRIRWLGAVSIIALVALCIAFFQLLSESVLNWERGYRWLASEISIWVGVLALLAWMAFRSGLPPRVRFFGAAIPALLLIAFS